MSIYKYKRIKFRATKRFIKEIRYIFIFLKNTFVNVRPVKGKLFWRLSRTSQWYSISFLLCFQRLQPIVTNKLQENFTRLRNLLRPSISFMGKFWIQENRLLIIVWSMKNLLPILYNMVPFSIHSYTRINQTTRNQPKFIFCAFQSDTYMSFHPISKEAMNLRNV